MHINIRMCVYPDFPRGPISSELPMNSMTSSDNTGEILAGSRPISEAHSKRITDNVALFYETNWQCSGLTE